MCAIQCWKEANRLKVGEKTATVHSTRNEGQLRACFAGSCLHNYGSNRLTKFADCSSHRDQQSNTRLPCQDRYQRLIPQHRYHALRPPFTSRPCFTTFKPSQCRVYHSLTKTVVVPDAPDDVTAPGGSVTVTGVAILDWGFGTAMTWYES